MVADRLAHPQPMPALDDAAWKARHRRDGQRHRHRLAASAADSASVEAARIADVDVFVITPAGADGVRAPVLLDIHGGARSTSASCSMRAASAIPSSPGPAPAPSTINVSAVTPREHTAPLDDCVAVYRALLEQRSPERIVVDGGSAGGNLVAAMLLRGGDEGLPMPAALMLFTPEIDLTQRGHLRHETRGSTTP